MNNIFPAADIEKLVFARDVLQEQIDARVAARDARVLERASAGAGPAKAGPSDEEVRGRPQEAGRYDEGGLGELREAGPTDEEVRGGPQEAGRYDEGGRGGPREAGPSDGAGAGGEKPRVHFRKSLRNPNINYRSGWWSVSVQVAKNKSIIGAIVGVKAVLNALGRAVEAYWLALPEKYPELELFDFVVMPNHFHALLRIHFAPTNREHHLGFLMSRFKGGTSFIYGKMRRVGEVEDIGDQLWQRDYWDDLVTSDEEFAGWQKYIRENPANWSSDRYGACTAFSLGDTELLNRPRIAFVASQGFFASELRPRKIWARPTKAGHSDEVDKGGLGGAQGVASKEAASADRVLISTFTSAQEREALRRALAKKRPLIAVFPAGIPVEDELDPRLAAAIREGWALAVSPQAPGSRLNKKIATWCNEFLLKNAEEIWVGDLSPNGMLTQMLAGLGIEGR